MSDLISREAAIECLEMFLDKQCDIERTKARGFSDNDIWEAVNMAYNALTAERVGKWIEHEWAEEYDGLLISNFECSECKSWEREKTNFCPNCGAIMRGEEDE